MEENNEQFSGKGNVSDALFGTSSDAIIEGLHKGVLKAQSMNDGEGTPGFDDKNQIVNEQDQSNVTNALEEDEYANAAANTTAQNSAFAPPDAGKNEAEAIIADTSHLDETGDTESGVLPENLEEDKIN